MYRDYGIAFGGKGDWNFGHDFARNVIIFGADNSSSSHSDNWENNFLVLGEGPTYDITKALRHQNKNLVLTLVKQ